MFKELFFPTSSADLSDIDKQVCLPHFQMEKRTSVEEISAIISNCSSHSAPGDDEIPFHFLKSLGKPVASAITHLANACLKLECYPQFLKQTRTIILKKPGKSSYEVPNA
jgi:hypothetical protein